MSVWERWVADGLVWLPEHGMGMYPVRAPRYDGEYWAKYAEYATTPLGRALNDLRLRLLERYAPTGSVLDVGIGCGQYLQALRGAGRAAFGYDVNPVAIAWLQERGWWVDAYVAECRVATFWDSLEHIPDAERMLARVGEWVLVSLPVFTDARHVVASRHFRKDEHVYYWTRLGLIRWMAEQGWRAVAHNTDESLQGREDIHTFVFQRAA